ncbi:MAG: response regulator, partial [Candidatus Symbiothrix sp.]|nr:response regulator [Candidatus Symbiothrix sp.]
RKYTILEVDDNRELRRYIKQHVGKYYKVLEAKNGKEGCNMAVNHVPDLIISDIMMPEVDGLQMTHRVKDDIRTCHIPVILLTARTNIQSKIDGLESGADAYIEKPFSIEHLQAQIQNLLDNRRKIRETFANSPFVHSDSIAMNKSDKQFLAKLTEVIYKNISNLDFNVDNLAEAMCMSRSSLLRKIKGISELTPNEFIRLIRLKRAAEILQAGEYKVNEVCYFVGFASNSYFTKAFQKQFGILPKNFGKLERG